MLFYVYMLLCADNTYYIGSTNDLEKRLHQHNFLKSGAHYTKVRRPVKLIYTESFPTISEARKREIALKKLDRKAKTLLLKNS